MEAAGIVALVVGGICAGIAVGIVIMNVLIVRAFWDTWK